MRRSTKGFLIAALSLTVVGGAFGIASVCLGFSAKEFGRMAEEGELQWIGPSGIRENVGEVVSDLASDRSNASWIFEDIESLDLDTGAVRCRLIPYEEDVWKVEGYSLTSSVKVRQDGDTLKIKGNGSRFPFFRVGGEGARIDIYIPPDVELAKLEADIGAGELRMEGEQYVKCRKLDLDCGVGSCTLNLDILKKAELDCGVGELTLNLAGAEEDFDYDLECGVGSLEIGGISRSGFGNDETLDNHASKSMDITCGVGSVQVNFEDR